MDNLSEPIAYPQLRRPHTPAEARVRRLLAWAQRRIYDTVLDTQLSGREHVPKTGGFLAVANHASHLDAGLVKMALGPRGDELHALAAQDYFFSTPLRRWFFGRFTNILPLERGGPFRGALKLAVRLTRAGHPLLVFPEGTRSRDGQMAAFKPAVSAMATLAQVPIVPIYLVGTHEALPKGATLVPRQRRIAARVGPAITPALLAKLMQGRSKHEGHRLTTLAVEIAVRALGDGRGLMPDELLSRVLAAEASEMQPDAPLESLSSIA